ncbi:MAG TPA: ATP-binding protein [Nitrospiraceae bacterium]|nr:ATP-binding protein [Nitrospiraceae bacterium]
MAHQSHTRTDRSPKQEKQTTLQRALTTALNELGADTALVGIFEVEGGPLSLQGCRGFAPREAQAVLRTLSTQDVDTLHAPTVASDGESFRAMRLRMITPVAKALLAVPLQHHQRTYGVMVIGRKESASFTKKEKTLLEHAGDQITAALARAELFDGTLLLRRPAVGYEPAAAAPPPIAPEPLAPPASYATPDLQERVSALLASTASVLPFDRALVTLYDPVTSIIEIIGMAGEAKSDAKSDPKRDLRPGLRLAFDSSAAGWAIRHRKARVDLDLASTQGRFLDHKPLYKEQFACALVVPFFVRGQVGGTVTVASKTAMQYSLPDTKHLEGLIGSLVELLQSSPAAATPVSRPAPMETGHAAAAPMPQGPSEPMIRKQERQAALGEFSAFLATEVREPLASVRAQLEDITREGILDFDPQTRVESAMRDLIRVEATLNEILDFAKPLELNRRPCRISEVIDSTLSLVATDLEMNRITVTKEYEGHPVPVRCDDAKMQQVFLSIIKNALEAMTPGGRLDIAVSSQKGGRMVQIVISNDGAPIPAEHVSQLFEPYFTTKRSGTGLGLATVKKIVDEHQGEIAIAGGQEKGTAVTIQLPAAAPRGGGRFRGRGGRGRRHRR